MKRPIRITLITIAVMVGLPFLLLCGYAFLPADFFSGPSEKDCIKTAERFLGCKLGKDYEILEYDSTLATLTALFLFPSDSHLKGFKRWSISANVKRANTRIRL